MVRRRQRRKRASVCLSVRQRGPRPTAALRPRRQEVRAGLLAAVWPARRRTVLVRHEPRDGPAMATAPPRSSCFPGTGTRQRVPAGMGPEAAAGRGASSLVPRKRRPLAFARPPPCIRVPCLGYASTRTRSGTCKDWTPMRAGWFEATLRLRGETGFAKRETGVRGLLSRDGRGRSFPRGPADVPVKRGPRVEAGRAPEEPAEQGRGRHMHGGRGGRTEGHGVAAVTGLTPTPGAGGETGQSRSIVQRPRRLCLVSLEAGRSAKPCPLVTHLLQLSGRPGRARRPTWGRPRPIGPAPCPTGTQRHRGPRPQGVPPTVGAHGNIPTRLPGRRTVGSLLGGRGRTGPAGGHRA